ncbi:MAG TPA: L-threonylcarbamoyladenylate synthase [Candidatus Peribacteraceae bacterium]|nr:L-threonylcarbamoyladenylate synthase [Candidatus Peribacteraceae bacterium]
MRILPFTDESLIEAVSILHGGGVIAHATETCYGLACDLSNREAVEKLFRIKKRPVTQPVSGLFASVNDARQYVIWTDRADELAKQYLPGPLTLILPMREDAPKRLYPVVSGQWSVVSSEKESRITNHLPLATIGVRISSHPHAQMLVEKFGSVISTTSANVHGLPNPYSADDIAAQFADAAEVPDLVLDDGLLPQVPPSTVINLATEEQEVQTLRQGLVKF